MRKSVLHKNSISEYVRSKIWEQFEIACKIYDEDPKFVYENNDSRKREYVEIRHLTMFLVRENHPQYSLEKIKIFFQMKQHATVIHGLKTFNNLINTDKKYRKIVESVLN